MKMKGKNMVKKILSMLMFGFVVAAVGAAEVDTACIYEIRPCYGPDRDYKTREDPVKDWSKGETLDASEPIYFNVRMVVPDGNNGPYATRNEFYLNYTNNWPAGSTEWTVQYYLDLEYNPFKIGIYVNGTLDYAEFVTLRRTPDKTGTGECIDLYDVIFKYVPKAGDLSLPIRLAMEDGSVYPEDYDSKSSAPSTTYLFGNSTKWTLKYIRRHDSSGGADGTIYNANMRFIDAGSVESYLDDSPDEGDPLNSNYSLKQCGFYLKTVDFEDNDKTKSAWEDPSYWKAVGKGKTTNWHLEALAPVVTNRPSLWVWSDNEDVVKIVNGIEKQIVEYYTDGGKTPHYKTVQMAEVKFQSGSEISDSFAVCGVESNKTANLILSGFDHYSFNISGLGGVMVTNFLTVPVHCKAPDPASLSLTRTGQTTYTVGSAYQTALTQLKLTLSESFSNDMYVTVAPVLTNPGGYKTNEIVRVNLEGTTDGYENLDPITIKIAKGETQQKIDVFGMGAKKGLTDGGANRIDFEIASVTPAEAADFVKSTAGTFLYFTPDAPSVTDPATVMTARVDVPQELELSVVDNYANVNDTNVGYIVWWKKSKNDYSSKFEKLTTASGETALWKPDAATGILYAFDKKTGLPSTTLPAVSYQTDGSFESIFYIEAPNGEVSGRYEVSVTVSEAARATVTALNLGDSGECYEGTNIQVKVTLTEKYNKNLYAYLELADTNLYSKLKDTQNLAVKGAKSTLVINQSTLVSPVRTITVDDGTVGGTDLDFNVVVTTSPNFSTNDVVTYYKGGTPLFIRAYNVAPTIQDVKMNNQYKTKLHDDGTRWMPKAVPQGVPVKFSLQGLFTEPSNRDKTSTNVTETLDERFRTRFTISETGSETVLYGNPNSTNFTYSFSSVTSGDEGCLVTVEMMDKDMADESTGGDGNYGTPFEFYVQVVDRPTISIESEDSYTEDSVGYGSANLTVNFSQAPTTRQKLKLTVTANSTEKKNPGTLELAGANLSKTTTNGVYVLDVGSGRSSETIYISRADGTLSTTTGFTINIDVITAGEDASTHQKWSDYYATESAIIIIKNQPPKLWVPSLDMKGEYLQGSEGYQIGASNAYVVGIGAADPVSFMVSDVELDLNTNYVRSASVQTNITVVWSVAGAVQFTTNITTAMESYSFTPRFTSSGLKTVSVSVTDKDTGTTRASWYYQVQAAKTLRTTANGPSGSSTALSQHYASAKGRGEGHTWAVADFASADNFTLTWNCALASSVNCYGFGYKAGAVDNGKLDGGKDQAIGPTGGNVAGASGPYYATTNRLYDSFLYCWVKTVRDENNVASSAVYGSIAAERPLAGSTPALVYLPTEKDDEGAYEDTILEAVFAREYLPTDNMGDINADGIPDLFVQLYKFDVLGRATSTSSSGTTTESDEDGTITGDDTASLSDYNEDGDYLPIIETETYSHFIPGLSNTWVTAGRVFNAKLEIRGWGDGLNDACSGLVEGVAPTRVYADPNLCSTSSLSYVEWVAFTNWCGRSGLGDQAWTNVANWQLWSPEKPTDPTKADTDDDDLSDGYEYYIWYKAHVGYIDTDGSYRRLSGRRYNEDKPSEPTVLTPDSLAAMFDPTVKYDGDYATGDIDNDGIPDTMEFLLGTNPFDYDTDGDGLPDGYELTMSNTDPLKDRSDGSTLDSNLNPDGDSMAFYQYVDNRSSGGSDERWWVIPVAGDGFDYVAVPATETVNTNATGCLALSNEVWTAWRYRAATESSTNEFALGHRLYAAESHDKLTPAGEITREIMDVMHFQVYQTRSFDPRTGWNVYPCFAGHLINSREFTHYDEAMLQAFYYHANGLAKSAITATSLNPWTSLWSKQFTNPLTPDTDGDGMPDGWELYVQAGVASVPKTPTAATDKALVENNAPSWEYSPLSDFALLDGLTDADNDGDGLDWPHEFSGLESVALYTNSTQYASNEVTIVLLDADWKNKWWPTDPWKADTDGDGLKDGDEGKNFIYGDNEHSSNYYEDCVAGGGLNPLSWDTDGDGLPDPWEVEFKGTAVTANSSTNSVRISGNSDWNDDGMDGTYSDAKLDYDHDGLANWQEYMVGAMRCWRYDDPIAQWTSHKLTADEMVTFTDKDWFDLLLNPESEKFNPGFGNEHFDLGVYFSCATNAFEQGSWSENQVKYDKFGRPASAYGHFYMFKDGWYHDLSLNFDSNKDNRFTRKAAEAFTAASPSFSMKRADGKAIYPLKYICCDPTKHDTDYDGMDDYYEIFHGLNPLLGKSGEIDLGEKPPYDVIMQAYYDKEKSSNPWSAEANSWIDGGEVIRQTRSDVKLRLKGATDSIYDFFQFPWLAGQAAADADGDNIRNQQEAILANVQAATTYLHTDPTALWMTDSSYEDSLTYRYYRATDPSWATSIGAVVGLPSKITGTDGKTYTVSNADFPWLTPSLVGWINSYQTKFNFWRVEGEIFDFEENEGYDSDHDFLSDFEEGQGLTENASDPQNHDDPIRHQAMWFGGDADKGFLQTPMPSYETVPYDEAAAEVRQDFEYFTVECWAKPDETTYDNEALQTLVERSIWTGAANAADEKYLRKNFLIGLKNGRWYAKFDSTGTDAKQQVEILDGPTVTTNWTHIAATYDGEALTLYVDGIQRVRKSTSLQPEHGENALAVNAYGELDIGTKSWNRSAISMLVGASANSYVGLFVDYQWQHRSQANVTAENPYGLGSRESNFDDDYTAFYRGYVDEVRVWDGARSASDISDDYKNRTRYTVALAIENRDAVYAAWKQGGRRSKLSTTTLPAELRFHWAFDHVAGAVTASETIETPEGFATRDNVTDAMAVWSRPKGWVSPWLDSISEIKSAVYGNHAWTTWIADTVGHMPRKDGTTGDSIYWSEDYAGYSTASSSGNGYTTFTFPRNCEVGSRSHQVHYLAATGEAGDPYSGDTRWIMVSENNGNSSNELAMAYRFSHRNRLIDGFDMLPFGSAFPKRITDREGGLWDSLASESPKASDAWWYTGSDADLDHLPDWWETYARQQYAQTLKPWESLTWDSKVNYFGRTMTAGEAYRRDLARGMYKDESGVHVDSGYADKRDDDKDGMPNWWEKVYGLDETVDNADEDPDMDGLSNYQEYLLGEYYIDDDVFGKTLKAQGVDVAEIRLNPIQMQSSAYQMVPDYFLKYSTTNHYEVKNSAGESQFYLNEYFGEMATDHDFIEDWWELLFDYSYTNPKRYDPLQDAEGDGWSTWAECRASLWGGYFPANLIDTWRGDDTREYVPGYPKPVLAVNVTYFGTDSAKQDISGHQLVVRTKSGQSVRVDATFVVPEAVVTYTDYDDANSFDSYIGSFKGDTILHGHMSPGRINGDSIIFQRAVIDDEKVYSWSWDYYVTNNIALPDDIEYRGTYARFMYWKYRYEYIVLIGGDIPFEDFATTVVIDNTAMIYVGTTLVGEADCITGEYYLDMTKIGGTASQDKYLYRVKYASRVGHEWPQTVYLSDTKELPEETSSEGDGVGDGHVREGKNMIEAFIDMDEDGVYDPGEPYGMVKNVDIGWHKTQAVTIELTDQSHVVPRYDVASCTDDRTVISGTGGANTETGEKTSDNSTSGISRKLVICRKSINGNTEVETADGSTKSVQSRKVANITLIPDSRAYLTEADVLGVSGKFDLDAKWLVRDAEKLGLSRDAIKSVGYEIVEQVTSNEVVSSVVLKSFINSFSDQRTVPSVVSPIDSAPVYSSSPTFTFTANDETMTAYELQIRRKDTKRVVYDSGITLLPGRTSGTVGQYVYAVTPPVYAGAKVCSGTVLGEMFPDATDYEWRVALFNAKFSTIEAGETGAWSAEDSATWAEFQMDTLNENRYPKMATGYGTKSVAVRYYGPTNVTAGMVWVEAHKSADFRDQAISRTAIADVSKLSSYDNVKAYNALLTGIEPGKRYFMAFIDFNGNGKRDDWESWGYANYVGQSRKAIYNPEEFEITASTSDFVVNENADFTIYIEDCDVNQNEIPDCLESDPTIDTDMDGIGNSDEDTYETDKAKRDTDTDVMRDGFEALYADTDPTIEDAGEYVDGDWMAFATIDATFLTFTDANGNKVKYMLDPKAEIPSNGDTVTKLDVWTTYEYPVATNDTIVTMTGIGIKTAVSGTVDLVEPNGTAVLVHDQVYEWFGFDPSTARSEYGVNTKPFTALDKYLLIRYRDAKREIDYDGTKYADGEEYVNAAKLWSQYALKPYDTDCDADGIADGWELYVGANPWNKDDRLTDTDGDGLALLYEYGDSDLGASSDPKNAETFKSGLGDKFVYDNRLATLDDDGKVVLDYRMDSDNDQLSNFIEGLVSTMEGFPTLDVEKMSTAAGQLVPDYFVRKGSLYLGEMFADHDMIEDWWEDAQPTELNIGGIRIPNYSRYVYDAARDSDDDGWNNWQETRAKIAIAAAVEAAGTNELEETISAAIAGDHPVPAVPFAISYDGNVGAGSLIVIKAWHVDEDSTGLPEVIGDPLEIADATWIYQADGKIPMRLSGTLGVTTNGYLRSGRTMFAAYVANEDGSFSPGAPYGCVTDVRVDYLTGEPVAIELTRVDATMLRVNLVDMLNLQATYRDNLSAEWTAAKILDTKNSDVRPAYYQNLTNYYVQAAALVDRGLHITGYAALQCPAFIGTNVWNTWGTATTIWDDYATSSNVIVRIYRSDINGKSHSGICLTNRWDYDEEIQDFYPVTSYKAMYGSDEPVFARILNLGTRQVLTEADTMLDGIMDFDWGALQGDGWGDEGLDGDGDPIVSATYRIVIQNGTSAITNANNNLAVAIQNRFEENQTRPTDLEVLTTGGQPTFRWTHSNSIGKLYPAFMLVVKTGSGKSAKVIYSSGVRRAPTRDSEGRYQFTAPIWPGMMTESGEVVEADKDYTWSVAMLDAKFTERNPYTQEACGTFRITPSGDYGTVAVAVKYMGPGKISTEEAERLIRVEAHSSPDFGGTPVGVGYVRHTDKIAAADSIEFNATVSGLPKEGTYYLRAFLDTDGDGERDDWESWGYANYVGTARKDVYTPYPVSFGSDAETPEAVIYLEDADTNNNKLPDVWEYDRDGKLGGDSTTLLGDECSPYVVTVDGVTKGIVNVYTAIGESGIGSLPFYSTLEKFANGESVSTISLGLALSGVSLLDLDTTPSVKISSFSLTDGLTFEVDAKATVDGDTYVPSAVTVKATVTVTVEYAEALTGSWKEAATATATVTVGGCDTIKASDIVTTGGQNLQAVINAAIAAHPGSCFFRVQATVK